MTYVTYNMQTFETIVRPQFLTGHIKKLAHDELGYNGSMWTYIILHRLYNWKGLKPAGHKFFEKMSAKKLTNSKVYQFTFDVPQTPMQFIPMDLIGTFHLISSAGNCYILTVICMLTGYIFCIPFK